MASDTLATSRYAFPAVMDVSPPSRLRTLAYLEGASFLLLVFIAMPLKYWAGWPLGVRVVGMAHGFLFLAYVFAIVSAVIDAQWTLRTGLVAFVASLLPFGPFVFEARLRVDAVKAR